MIKEKVISVRVSEEFYNQLMRLADKLNTTVSDIARTALINFIVQTECRNKTITPNEYGVSREMNAEEKGSGGRGTNT